MSSTPKIFWKEYRETVAKNFSDKFGFIHAAAVNKLVMETFGFRTVPELWAWKKANRATITRQVNLALKPRGLRLGKTQGYSYTEKLAA
jgi:hypothetical protein